MECDKDVLSQSFRNLLGSRMRHASIRFPCQVLTIISVTCESALPLFHLYGLRPRLTGLNSSLPSRKACLASSLRRYVIFSGGSIRHSPRHLACSPHITVRVSDFGVHGLPVVRWRLSSRLSPPHGGLFAMPKVFLHSTKKHRIELSSTAALPRQGIRNRTLCKSAASGTRTLFYSTGIEPILMTTAIRVPHYATREMERNRTFGPRVIVGSNNSRPFRRNAISCSHGEFRDPNLLCVKQMLCL